MRDQGLLCLGTILLGEKTIRSESEDLHSHVGMSARDHCTEASVLNRT